MSKSQNFLHYYHGEDGRNTYTNSTQGAYDEVFRQSLPTVLEALAKIPFNPSGDGAFTICDYGAADGGLSMDLIGKCIEAVKARHGVSLPVSVVYEDQPVNDFKSVFMRVHGLIPGPPSYYQQYPGVYVSAVGTSFYSQCVPDDSVHLGFSSMAFQWLSKRPVALGDAMIHLKTSNSNHKQLFADQAAQDWEVILLHRAKELKRGGQLVAVCSNGYQNGGEHSKESLYVQMVECWSEMEAEGKITQEECHNFQYDIYLRTEADYRAPFQPGRPVYEAGLRVVSVHTQLNLCPYYLKWTNEHGQTAGDPDAAKVHAKAFIDTLRVLTNSSLIGALSSSRSQEEKLELSDDYFAKYESRVAAAPQDHGMGLMYSIVHIEKV